MTYSVIGTCSLCGGQVTLPTCWYSVIPPTPTCSSCGSIASQHGKVIEMTPTNTKPVRIIASNNTIPIDDNAWTYTSQHFPNNDVVKGWYEEFRERNG